ncbi:MAG: helix-turn-helix transcriptional regulator [Acidimicrobiales bacterium]
MSAATTIRTARRRSGMTLRALAALADTSHSTIAAYESGSKIPTTATLERVVRAAGFALDVSLHRRVEAADLPRGEELRAVLEVAAEFPARHSPKLECPVFGRGPA